MVAFGPMATEVWFRNPERFMTSLVDVGATKIVWHRGLLQRKRTDPLVHARLSFPQGADWRVLVVDVRGALEYTPICTRVDRPAACYPVWHYGSSIEELERLLETDCAESGEPFADDRLFTPVEGQEHRVLISGWPDPSLALTQKFLATLGEIQQDYPDTIVHLFEARSYRAAFAWGLRAADLDPATTARFKKVFLASGREVSITQLAEERNLQWVHLHGYSLDDLNDVDTRIAFNIRTGLWAGEYYAEKFQFRSTRFTIRPSDVDAVDYTPPETLHFKSSPAIGTVGDKVACDRCSLSNRCKFVRVGSVCNLPESETASLAKFFKTRDAETVIDGLSAILQTQAQRAAVGMEAETDTGQLDGEVSRILSNMFDGGVKLAKLLNPVLAQTGPKIAVQINAGNGRNEITAANPKALMAALVRELEERGIPREDITPEMVMGMVQPKEIEAEVIE